MKLNIKFPILNVIMLATTYVLFYLYFNYLKLNNETTGIINQALFNKDYSEEFKVFIEIFKMPEFYMSSLIILLFSLIIYIMTYLASQYKLKSLTISTLSVALISFSYLSYKTYEIEKYIDDTVPVISNLLNNEVLYTISPFQSAFFNNTKFYIEEYKKLPNVENKMKYSMSLYFIPDKISLINSLNNDNVKTYQEIMKLNFQNQLNYKRFTNYSIFYLFLISIFNILILFKERKIK